MPRNFALLSRSVWVATEKPTLRADVQEMCDPGSQEPAGAVDGKIW